MGSCQEIRKKNSIYQNIETEKISPGTIVHEELNEKHGVKTEDSVEETA